jgi:ABC-type transport system substrate-binding protein
LRQFKRRPLEEAKQLLAEAGYPNGRDAKTGQPLTLYFDTMPPAGRKPSRAWTGSASSSPSWTSSWSFAPPTTTASRTR